MNRITRVFVTLLAVLAVGFPAVAQADLSAHFGGGNSTEVVDAYTGVAGDGWQGPWVQSKKNLDPVLSAVGVLQSGDLGYAEMHPGESGPYLNVMSVGTLSSTDVRNAECRDYMGDLGYFDPSRPHTIQFSVRINEVSTGFDTYDGDFYMVQDYPSAFNNSSSAMHWAVRVDGAEGKGVPGFEWRFVGGVHDGGSFPEGGGTGVTLETGAVFDFTIEVDPTNEVEGIGLGTWVGTIVKTPMGGGPVTSYTGPTMGWRHASNEAAGFLNFISRANTSDDVRDWSIDNIVITQEPGLPLPGDATRNGVVDDDDAARLAANWLRTSDVGWDQGDFNLDGVVDDRDAAILAAHWVRNVAGGMGGTSEVPEPSTFILILGAAAALLSRRRR